jgi:phosphopantothenoylcysteine decarboxylase/phosphopantothenate--cysteine ligase
VGDPTNTQSAESTERVAPLRVLITAGPTHEPIDAVRYIGNRSSGRMGVALARAAAERGWAVTLLLGPVGSVPSFEPGGRVRVERFTTCEDLRRLLRAALPTADLLIMAAAVADFTPAVVSAGGKRRRGEGPFTLELRPTPDLLAEAAAGRRPGQTLVGFALEAREELLGRAEEKLRRKGVDYVVANPLETMDAESVEAVVIAADGRRTPTPGVMPKARFAAWLLDVVTGRGA